MIPLYKPTIYRDTIKMLMIVQNFMDIFWGKFINKLRWRFQNLQKLNIQYLFVMEQWRHLQPFWH